MPCDPSHQIFFSAFIMFFITKIRSKFHINLLFQQYFRLQLRLYRTLINITSGSLPLLVLIAQHFGTSCNGIRKLQCSDRCNKQTYRLYGAINLWDGYLISQKLRVNTDDSCYYYRRLDTRLSFVCSKVENEKDNELDLRRSCL